MSNDQNNANDPLGFVRNMWGNMGFGLPGMAAPTFDTDELDKRIKDLKAVEGWLRMNLSMLQMTIQGLEMQTTTLSAVKAMGSMAANAAQQAAQHVSQHAAAQPQPAPAPVAPQAAPAPTEQLAADSIAEAAQAAGAFSQAAMWPWNLMQQMQEHLHEQAEAAKAAKAAAKPARKSAPKKPAAAKAAKAGGTTARAKA